MKPTKCPAQEKKWGKKSEKRGEERKQKVKDLEILLFAHARTSQANILHLDQMAAKGMTSKWLCVSFSSL